MFKKSKKKIKISQYIFCIIFLLLISFNLVLAISAEELKKLKEAKFGLNPLADEIGFQPGKAPALAETLGQVIGMVLSLLGVIFLILMIYGGFTWMTARGDNEKVTNSKNIIINATIGAIVVFGAYAISSYIINFLSTAV